MLQCCHIVADLTQIFGAALDCRASLGCQQFILLERTASRLTKGRIRTWGFGSRPPSPANLPISRSESESTPMRRGVHSSTGGKGAGTKAEYAPKETVLPGMRDGLAMTIQW